MSIMMYTLRHLKRNTLFIPKPAQLIDTVRTSSSDDTAKPKLSTRLEEFKKKLREEEFIAVDKPSNREVTPIMKLDQKKINVKVYREIEYEPFPNNTNPVTGEINGPKGPEPTRYGDWERKGRCSDF